MDIDSEDRLIQNARNLRKTIEDQRAEITRLAKELEEAKQGQEVLVWRDAFTGRDFGLGTINSPGSYPILCAVIYEDCFRELFGAEITESITKAKKTMKVKMWSED